MIVMKWEGGEGGGSSRSSLGEFERYAKTSIKINSPMFSSTQADFENYLYAESLYPIYTVIKSMGRRAG